MPSPVDATCCPLCGQDNRCAMERQKATGQPQPTCWCASETFTPELLARIPDAARGKACLCPACVRAVLGSPG